MFRIGISALLVLLVTAPPSARAVDLTTLGASATVQSVLFTEGNAFPSASDVHQPFLRVQATGTEQGFNTDFRPLEPDAIGTPTVTHSIRLRSLARRFLTASNHADYYLEFWIDANESTLSGENYLSIDQLRLYTATTPSIGTSSQLPLSATLRYDMDLPTDQQILLDSTLEPGSGVPTVTIDIPTSYFADVPDSEFVYVFVRAGGAGLVGGRQYGSSGGFEELSALVPSSPAAVPVTEAAPAPSIRVVGGVKMETMRFRCSAPQPGRAAIHLYDVRGRAVARVRRDVTAGPFDVPLSSFGPGGLASGVYFYRFDWNGVPRATGKIAGLR
jgi:hypothetical protein